LRSFLFRIFLAVAVALLVAVALFADDNCPAAEMSTSSASVVAGKTVMIYWATKGAKIVNISPGREGLAASGSFEATMNNEETFKLIAKNETCTKTLEVTVKVIK
jgi:hypothetical protein